MVGAGSFKVDCLAAPGPKTFDTNLMRGALSSFFQFLLKVRVAE